MTQEWIIKTLVGLGLSQIDAEVYIFLSTVGPQNARNIADMLKLYKQELYRSLKRLQVKGIVNSSAERPAVFSSISFDKVLDLFLVVKKEEANVLQESRDEPSLQMASDY